MEENKEIIQEDIKKEKVKKNITKKKIPMYVYIVGIVVVLIIILIIALAVMANSDEEVPPVEQPVVEENVNDKDLTTLTENDVKKIYNESLPFISDYVGTTIYHTDKMTVSNANQSFLRAFSFSKIAFNEDNVMVPINEDGTEFRHCM